MTSNLVSLQNGHLSLMVSDVGAEMQTLCTSDGQNILWNGDADFWTGRAPILFPIVGRAPNDKIAVGDYEADMPQHGFARRSVFELDEETPNMCRHSLRDTKATRQVYPFQFRLSVTHCISGNTLEVQAVIENCGQQSMPFGFGFHPAFCWPLPSGEG